MAPGAASVTLYYTLFTSPDLDLLVELCGYRNRYEAIGRMAVLYSRVTAEKLTTAPARTIEQCLGITGPAALSRCHDLAEVMADGAIRIRGAERRTRWFQSQAEKAINGGRARMAEAKRDDRGRLVSASPEPAHGLDKSSPEPAQRLPAVQPQGSGIRDQGDLTGSRGEQVPPDLVGRGSGGTTAPRQAEPADKRKKRISPDWQPTQAHRELAKTLGVDVDHEAELFRDHWLGKGEPRLDWDASFRTWLRNAKRFGTYARKANGQLAVGRVEPMAAADYPEGDVDL